jgi:hypothetical protein
MRYFFQRIFALQTRRYTPFYVGPLHRADAVIRALEETLHRAGSGRILRMDEAAAARSDDVVVTSIEEAARYYDLTRGNSEPAPRWVVWGESLVGALPDRLRSMIDDQGAVFDTRDALGRGGAEPSPLGRALGAAVAESEKAPLIFVGTAPDVGALAAAEVQVRLEVLGFGPVAVREASNLDVRTFGFVDGERSATVVHLVEADEVGFEHAVALAERARDRATGLAIVAEPQWIERLLESPEWRGAVEVDTEYVRLVPEEVPESVKRVQWPPVRTLLVGAPRVQSEWEPSLHVPGGSRPLYEVLQTAEVWRQEGYFLVYTRDSFGWIGVVDEVVTGAARLGDPDGGQSEEEVSSRIRDMAMWANPHVAFVTRGVPQEPRLYETALPLMMVALDVRRTVDEARAGRIEDGSLAPPVRPRPAFEVAGALVYWGLLRYASDLLRQIEQLSSWGIEEGLMLGYLAAERDPTEAVARLQHALARLGRVVDHEKWVLQVDSTLDALLLEVRARPVQAAASWAVVDRWLESAGGAWIRTSRHAAILYELAVRAGQREAALRFRDRVFELAKRGDPLPELIRAADAARLLKGAGD